MSSVFPNMIPSEPPPLDSLDDEEAEDEYYGNYTSTGLQLDVLAENSPMPSPRKTLPGGIVSSPCTPEKRQTNLSFTVNGTSDYSEIENSERDEVDINHTKPELVELPEPVLLFNNINHTPTSLQETVQYDLLSKVLDEEDQDDFGDFHSPELGNELSETNSKPDLPNVSNTSSCHSLESKSESVQIEREGLKDSFAGVDKVPETLVVDERKEDNPEKLYCETAEQRRSCDIPTPTLEKIDLKHFHTEHLKPESHSEADDFEDEFGDFSNAISVVPKNLFVVTADCEEDEFGEFSGEASAQNIVLQNQSLPCLKLQNDFEEFPGNAVLKSHINASSRINLEGNTDDDFGDFHCSTETEESRPPMSEPNILSGRTILPLRTTFVGVPQNANAAVDSCIPASVIEQQSEKSMDFAAVNSTALERISASNSADLTFDTDFGDFKAPEQIVLAPVALTRRDSEMESKLNSIVATAFPKENVCQETITSNFSTQAMNPIDKELNRKTNPSWNHIQEFEDSYGLKFKWAQSRAHSLLLKSLRIDTCIVLRNQKWGTIEVPKFAASLGDIPLQPLAPLQPTIVTMPSSAPLSVMTPVSSAKSPISPVVSSSVFNDFQEFQSHKTAPSRRDSVSTGSTRDSSQVLNSQTSSAMNSGKINEGNLSSMSQLSSLSFSRTQDLVFPSTPMFHE